MPQSIVCAVVNQQNQYSADGIKKEDVDAFIRTVVLAVPSYAESACLDVGEAETNGFAERRSVDVWDPVLVTNPPVGEVEALPGHVTLWILHVVCAQPILFRS